MKVKVISLLIVVLLLFAITPGISAEGADSRPVVGVAWRSNQESETFVAACKAIEAAGGRPVILGQVLSPDLVYENNMLIGSTDADGALTAEAAKLIRCNTWQGSNVEEVMDGITAIVFPGGEDISPSLFYSPQPVETREGISAERDVSDFLLMSWCLEKDIPILAICRGMQLLAVVSGADMIQDITLYMSSLGKEYGYEHRYNPETPKAYRNFAAHDVKVTAEDSLLFRLIGTDTIKAVPSWHHQAVRSVDGTRLIITGETDTAGERIIEAIERPDKTFVLGLQYHPEIAVVRETDEASLIYFTTLVNMAKKIPSYAFESSFGRSAVWSPDAVHDGSYH